MRKDRRVLAAAVGWLVACSWALGAEPPRAEVDVRVDFGVQADYPLSKTKFTVYNSGWVPLAHYERDMPLYDEVRPYALRIDLGWGTRRWRGRQPVDGTPDALRYEFGEMDRLATLLNERGVLPYWAYSYIPPPLQATPRRPNGTTTRPDLWGQAVGTFAGRATTSPALRIGFHEIYNEPDNRDFFRGTVDDYLALYRAGTRAIRAADPDAVVGGPAIAFTDAWVAPFLDAVVREQLPLDFFSFHYYPTVPYRSPNVAGVVRDMRAALAARPELAAAEMHLNEFNSYRIDYPEGGRQDRHAMAPAMLHDFAYFLTQPGLTQVSWAQFQDTGGGNWSGMISRSGHRKASFNAYHLYQQMPVDRRQVTVNGDRGVEALASADEGRAAVLLWNRAETGRQVRIKFNGVSFPTADLRVLRIDARHASWGDHPANERLEPVERRSRVATHDFAWSGEVPKDGVVYLELAGEPPATREAPPPFTGKFVRALRFFPNRDTTSYADFDPRTFTVRTGMGTEAKAQEQVGAVVERWPEAVAAVVETDGAPRRADRDSCLAVRLDYATGAGFTSSVLFPGACKDVPALYDEDRQTVMSWGTRRAPDRVVTVPELSSFTFRPAAHAPAGWTGRAVVTFLMQNTGAGARAKFQLHGTR